MAELPTQVRQIRDFFFKQALALSPERDFLHQPGLIPDQTLFRLEDLRRHLNNPFLDLDYVQVVDRGQLVDLRAARCFKVVQRRQIEFANLAVIQQHLENGAACLLEGIDILEPQVNLLMATLDRARTCTFSNAVVFFSQRGNEAYRGHLDTDDVLAIQLGGSKKWRLHRRQAPRRVDIVELSDATMGPVETELVMNAGDALYVRSGTPHRVETVGDYSLHLSIDLCDRTVSVETALTALLKRYDRDSVAPYSAPGAALEKVVALSRTEEFKGEIEAAQLEHKAKCEEFRRVLGGNHVSFFDPLIAGQPRQ